MLKPHLLRETSILVHFLKDDSKPIRISDWSVLFAGTNLSGEECFTFGTQPRSQQKLAGGTVQVLLEGGSNKVDTACPATGAGGSRAVEGGSRHGGVEASAAHVVEPDGCGTAIHAGQNPPGPL